MAEALRRAQFRLLRVQMQEREGIFRMRDLASGETLRVLDDGTSWRVGRVATAEQHRGRGLAAAMVREVLARHRDREVVLDAQAHLEQWYAGFGFTVTGSPYADEDGILHVPMRRPAVR